MAKKGISFVLIKGKRLPFIVGYPNIGQTVVIIIADINPHAAIGIALMVCRAATNSPILYKLARSVVEIQEILNRIVANINVEVAIHVEIAGNGCQAFSIGPKSSLFGKITKSAVAVA